MTKKNKQPTLVNEVKEVKEVNIKPIITNNGQEIIEDNYSLQTGKLDFETEVYDDGEIASALELGFIAKALEKHKEKLAPETHPDFDGESCIVCGETIPKIRLKMGKIRCVFCQEILEKRNKMIG